MHRAVTRWLAVPCIRASCCTGDRGATGPDAPLCWFSDDRVPEPPLPNILCLCRLALRINSQLVFQLQEVIILPSILAICPIFFIRLTHILARKAFLFFALLLGLPTLTFFVNRAVVTRVQLVAKALHLKLKLLDALSHGTNIIIVVAFAPTLQHQQSELLLNGVANEILRRTIKDKVQRLKEHDGLLAQEGLQRLSYRWLQLAATFSQLCQLAQIITPASSEPSAQVVVHLLQVPQLCIQRCSFCRQPPTRSPDNHADGSPHTLTDRPENTCCHSSS
mmetsp:Transcript_45324/g.85031  ORF Transcript_45324/g.85031 Transcript_45324/m.85031 type:complete len:278 (-) Transcript_45324:525-1358(-)